MKKIFSTILAVVMAISMTTVAWAAPDPDTPDISGGGDNNQTTTVTYTGNGTESYTVTVPASLTPGASGNVKISGTWASNRELKVTADSTVTMTNNLDKGTKTLAVAFDGINRIGNNETAISDTEAISIENISNALFGTWTGSISYTVSMSNSNWIIN